MLPWNLRLEIEMESTGMKVNLIDGMMGLRGYLYPLFNRGGFHSFIHPFHLCHTIEE